MLFYQSLIQTEIRRAIFRHNIVIKIVNLYKDIGTSGFVYELAVNASWQDNINQIWHKKIVHHCAYIVIERFGLDV